MSSDNEKDDNMNKLQLTGSCIEKKEKSAQKSTELKVRVDKDTVLTRKKWCREK